MSRSSEPSAAARQLVAELADRGLDVGYRSIEDWGRKGLAPAPVRRSLGRGQGTVSQYPPGAADQYAAVAEVMRRGLPWQAAVLKMLARGHLAADQDLVRRAFRDLLASGACQPGEDALGCAERAARRAATAGVTQPFLRALRRNLRRSAAVLEPGSEIGPVVTGVVATMHLAMLGEPTWSEGAIAEMLAALPIPVAEMTEDTRREATRFMDAFLRKIIPGPALAAIAANAPLGRIQAAVPAAREAFSEAQCGGGQGLPRVSGDTGDIITAFLALLLIRIEDLGGWDAVNELISHAIDDESARKWN